MRTFPHKPILLIAEYFVASLHAPWKWTWCPTLLRKIWSIFGYSCHTNFFTRANYIERSFPQKRSEIRQPCWPFPLFFISTFFKEFFCSHCMMSSETSPTTKTQAVVPVSVGRIESYSFQCIGPEALYIESCGLRIGSCYTLTMVSDHVHVHSTTFAPS